MITKRIKGHLEWVETNDKSMSMVKWVEHLNGKYEITRYNWLGELLVWLGLIKRVHFNNKYMIGVDPYKEKSLPVSE